MPGPILESLEHATARLTARGLNATSDPRNLNLPAVWVTLEGLHLDRLSGDAGAVDVALYAIVPDTGTPGTLTQLDTLVETIDLEFPARDWEPRAVALPSMSATPLPALYTTITLDWRRTP